MFRQKIDKLLYCLAILCLCLGCALTIVQLVGTRQTRFYKTLNNDDKLAYVLQTYYDEINLFLEIPPYQALPKENIIISDTLESDEYVGQYDPATKTVTLNTKILSDLGYTVAVLVHEMTHHKQCLEQNTDMLFTEYHAEAASGKDHDDISYEQECEYASSIFVARQGLFYYNGKGCPFYTYCVNYLSRLFA